MAPATAVPRANAFGVGSPSWNLAFPAGNLTAAEILAYLPHWIKSIDVINRFISNGGRSATITTMINEFRYVPSDLVVSNSVQIMMSYNMRQAGHKNWTVGTHMSWKCAGEVKEDNLNVKDFRPPRVTHPRGGNVNGKHNAEPSPIYFKDLALHVKEHPGDGDALDLTRCVMYALAHENETWLFPADFARLVTHLGGPQEVTHSHFDKYSFARRESALSLTPRAPKGFNCTLQGRHEADQTTMTRTRIEMALLMARSTTPKNMTPQKRDNDLGRVLAGSKRRSGRLVGKDFDLREYDSDATDKDFFGSPYSGISTPAKKRKTSRIALPAECANDSDFVQDDSEPDDDIPDADDTLEEDEVSPSKARIARAAANKARAGIKTAFIPARPPPALISADVQFGLSLFKPEFMSKTYDPEITQAALKYSTRDPEFLKPPVLSTNRLRVDESSIHIYAVEGCMTRQEMWGSALSSTRFNGPRRSAPYRELYRLTDPSPHDASDWAENIRWAKEQKKLFGSDTWTEYDYHLEQITFARQETLWVSEEAIRVGM